jgi:pimeloyl-ACP methyl ester carboxylesterase
MSRPHRRRLTTDLSWRRRRRTTGSNLARMRVTSRLGTRVASTVVCLGVLMAPVGCFGRLAPSSEAQPHGPRFERSACWVDGDWARDVQRECGWLVVPESRDRPSTHSVRLAVEIFRAREPTGAPPRVFLHGGPGGPGGIRLYSEGVARGGSSLHRDVVIYDQRGAGFSQPKLCAAYDAAPDAAVSEARRACIAELDAQGVDRYAYNTAASVADLIDLRRTLGYESWDVYGVSYGARIAQEVMARDGRGIHSVVLASPVARSFSHQAEQPLSTQHALEHVFAACARQPSCRDAFPNVEEDFYAVYDDLMSSPVQMTILRPDSTPETVRFDGSRLVADIRSRLLYRPRAAVARLPLLLHELRKGDRARAAREILGEGAEKTPDAALRTLINCSDHATYGAAYRRTLDSVNAKARPPFRRSIEHGCEEWLPHLRDGSMPPPVLSDIPTLILTGYFDDRTPREHAARIAATLSRAYIVEFPDEGHDTRPGVCHAVIVQRFLEDPSRQPDTSCIPTISPIPFATTWESARDP